MTTVDAIRERMEEVVGRLESAVEAALTARAGESDAKEELAARNSEVEALKTERDGLNATLEAIRAENGSLRQAADAVSNRLEATIGRLQSVLDG